MFRLLRAVVYIVFYVIEFILAVRFLLKFFDANPSSPFVVWVNNVTSSLVAPFQNIFPPLQLGTFVIDMTTIVALLIYSFIVYLIMRVLYFLEFPKEFMK